MSTATSQPVEKAVELSMREAALLRAARVLAAVKVRHQAAIDARSAAYGAYEAAKERAAKVEDAFRKAQAEFDDATVAVRAEHADPAEVQAEIRRLSELRRSLVATKGGAR